MQAMEMLSVAEVAAILKVRPKTVYKYRQRHVIPEPIKIGGKIVWQAAVLQKHFADLQKKANLRRTSV